jgi:hypothetical protein
MNILPSFASATLFNEDDFRLLFLDIDGVLNSSKTLAIHRCFPWPSSSRGADGRELLDEPPVRDVQAFDHLAIKLVNLLCEKADAHIVLSSTWRMGLNVDQIQTMLTYAGLDGSRIIGRTSQANPSQRGSQIARFLEDIGGADTSKHLVETGHLVHDLWGKSLSPTSYVILDDDGDMTEEQKASHFVQTQFYEGLTLDNAVSAGIILTGPQFSF